MLIVSTIAEEPLVAAMLLADDGAGATADRYGDGPMPPNDGCSDLSDFENLLTLAAANYYPIAVAIREEAASLLGLDLGDENDVVLGNTIAAMFLYCYFVDYMEQVNIWLVANGGEPMDFGGGSRSQINGMAQQMRDLLGERMDNSGARQQSSLAGRLRDGWNSLFDSENTDNTLDTEPEEQYNDEEEGDSVPSRAGANGPDIGELNPIRYRGYYLDEETGYYFCQTRYYSPEWRRWINADCLFIAGDHLTAANMYAYCDGNPVMYVDPSGMANIPIFDSVALAKLVWGMIVAAVKNAFAQELLFFSEEDAVHHFAVNWNEISIKDDREYATFIYETTYNGMTMYSYVRPWRGTSTESFIPINWFGLRKKVANAHTHGAKTYIHSDTDIEAAKKAGLPEYVVIATGAVWVYYPATDSYKQFKEWTDIPSKKTIRVSILLL